MPMRTINVGTIVAYSTDNAQQGNSTAEFDIMNYTLPAGVIRVGDFWEILIPGRNWNNSGAGVTLRYRLYIGGSLIADSGASDTLPSSANRPYVLRWSGFLKTIAETQSRWELYQTLEAQAAETEWQALSTAGEIRVGGNSTPFTTSFASAVTFRATVTMGTANAGCIIVTDGWRFNRYRLGGE